VLRDVIDMKKYHQLESSQPEKAWRYCSVALWAQTFRGEGPRVSAVAGYGSGGQKMNSMARIARDRRCAGAVATGLAQMLRSSQVEQKQQNQTNQRMFTSACHRYGDQETMLEDPAITKFGVTGRADIGPDSNEQNIESRVLTLDDLQVDAVCTAPVASEGMEFVPGKVMFAGRTEQATEPGM